MRYAQVDDEIHELMTRKELTEWAQELSKFEGRDYKGILTLMVHFNMFDEFLEASEEACEDYYDFLESKNLMNGTKH